MLTEDETREAFARLRADELPRVSGTGTALMHRTVRRRRATTIAAAVSTAFAVAGGAAVAVGAATPEPAAPPAPAAPDPVSTEPDLVRLGEQASRALDVVVTGDYRAEASGPLTKGIQDAHEATMPAGRYRLAAACVGAGKARFEVVQNGHAEGFDVVCDGTPGTLEFTYQPVFTLHVSVEPDSAADGHAGFAYRVE